MSEFAKLPGIGRKSAERLAYHILRVHKTEALALADAIRDVRENVRYCRVCFNLTETEECAICRDPKRDRTQLCIVEQPRDVMALEQAGVFRGLYHVLLGRIAPLEGIGPDQLTVDALTERVRGGTIREVIMATNPTVEGDGTALYISNQLADQDVTITRLARGITTGSILEYTNKEILADALSGRQKL
jgi:recombination protein RecR